MKNYKLVIKAEAEEEISLAYFYYENKSSGLGERFLVHLENCFQAIDINPNTFQFIYKKYRQAVIKVFPFVVIYQVINKEVIVFAVFHTSQNPNEKIRI